MGICYLGASPTLNRSIDGLSATVASAGYLRAEFAEKKSVVEAIEIASQIEHLFSLLCFSYVKCTGLDIVLELQDAAEWSTKRALTVDRGLQLKSAKTEFEPHELPISMEGYVDFGAILGRFLKIFDDIEQTLNWYRIVVAEERYLVDKYFYCVRMIDALYQRLHIKIEGDVDAIQSLDEISAVLEREEKISSGVREDASVPEF